MLKMVTCTVKVIVFIFLFKNWFPSYINNIYIYIMNEVTFKVFEQYTIIILNLTV